MADDKDFDPEDISDESEDVSQNTFEDIAYNDESSSSQKTSKEDFIKSRSQNAILEADSDVGSEDSIDFFTDVADHLKASGDKDGEGQRDYA